MRLRRSEFCPVYRSISCCSRELLPKPRLVGLGVQRVEDPHHPRGYRKLRSPAEMRKLLNRKIREQAGMCAICHEEFTDYNDIVPDLRIRGMGGAWRDDHLPATHWWCNSDKGSTRVDVDGRSPTPLRIPRRRKRECARRVPQLLKRESQPCGDNRMARVDVRRDWGAGAEYLFCCSAITDWIKGDSQSSLALASSSVTSAGFNLTKSWVALGAGAEVLFGSVFLAVTSGSVNPKGV